MAAASFLIFFMSYLVAPLIPALAAEFHASTQFLGLLVPAYMLPYGISALFYFPFSDRIGRRPVLLTLIGSLIFQALLQKGFGAALIVFGIVQALSGLAAIPLFSAESAAQTEASR